MAVKKVSKKGKGSFAAYKAEDRIYKNTVRRLERHLKNFPEDAVAKAKLDGIKAAKKAPWIRKKPTTKGGWNRARPRKDAVMSYEHVMSGLTISEAKIFAEVYASCDSTRRSLTKEEQKMTKAAMAAWSNFEFSKQNTKKQKGDSK